MNKVNIKYLFVILLFLLSAFVTAQTHETLLQKFHNEIDLSVVYPDAEKTSPMKGDIPALEVYKDNQVVGYIIVNNDFGNTIGYSGKPIHTAIGVDKEGFIKGVQVLKHSEPIVLIGIPLKRITDTFKRYEGFNVVQSWLKDKFSSRKIDSISGATVTDRVIDDSVLRDTLKLAAKVDIAGLASKLSQTKTAKLKSNPEVEVQSWQALVDSGAISRMRLSVADISQRFKDLGYPLAVDKVESDNPEDTFIDLYVALVSVPEIGKSILGDAEYKNLENKLEKDQQALLVMANGIFSFRGSGFVRGGAFDRFTVEQDANSYWFRDLQYKRLGKARAEGAPSFEEIGLFRFKKEATFDPTKPWQFNLLVNRAINVDEKKFYNQVLSYQLPNKYFEAIPTVSAGTKKEVSVTDGFVLSGDDGRAKLIRSIWHDKLPSVVILILALIILTVIFFFQDTLTRYAKATKIIRNTFLVFSVVWIGFMMNGQVSVVNILTFVHVLMDDFKWELFLLDPIIFILWCSLAVILILWGRGAYCGWLCPFGALQELLNKVAKYFHVPQVRLPWGLHERLWAVKYIIFLGLLGASLQSLEWAEHLSEVEPFKTSIILNFSRSWPFVVYALALLTIGLFIERFFCRYLCPLGAALAIPAKLKIFDWIKRYPNECGSPCQICANECMVDSIHPEGKIDENECLHCMHCQVLYHDKQRCPAVIKFVKREARHEKQREEAKKMKIEKEHSDV